jgi:parvulin-like peptidyl-prolyl isomerase
MLNRFRVGLGLCATLALCLSLGLVLAGCGAPDTPLPEETVLIRTDRQTVTKGQFERAFEAAKIAYSDNRSVDPQLMEQARLRLLNQMTEELIIGRRAEEMGIVLDDQELETAIQAIKKEYQDNEFEQMLLESAIPYSLWKDRLRVRLLMEKVVDRDLAQSITISAKDIEDYYKAHEEEFAVDQEKPPEADLKHRIVAQLRREKVETAYPQWMDGLRKRYQVKINWELWAKRPGADSKPAARAEE